MTNALVSKEDVEEIARGRHRDPFAVLGPHRHDQGLVIRTIQPGADAVSLIDRKHQKIVEMTRIHQHGVFEAPVNTASRDYLFNLRLAGENSIVEDPYRFPSSLGDLDHYLIGEGTHDLLHESLGAHPARVDGIDGVQFAVWAPNASRVSVVGEMNNWDGRCHPMRHHPATGIWEIFLPCARKGHLYKFEIVDPDGQLLPLKADPFAFKMQLPPDSASIVYKSQYAWNDQQWQRLRSINGGFDFSAPMTAYEIHTGSWRRADNQCLSYRDLADQLVPYLVDMGFSHLELMPVTAHPYGGSWGYQPIGMFAADCRQGDPDDLRYLIDQCHLNSIAVIIDWVPAHFPKDEHGLACFDGTRLYEHADPRRGDHPDWGTHEFNLSRREVINYLTASALFWVKEFHIDALRVDAVASMLYLDYSREDGQWLANEFGGNQDLDAVAFLRHLNTRVHAAGAITIAEESTAWPAVSRPVEHDGLGFSLKWNMGWMNDSLAYMSEDPIHRRYHHDKLTFGLHYAFSENFVLPLSHDEVVHGKGSLLEKMPGDRWQRFGNLRAYIAFMYAHPGKKLLFMGNEFAQNREWNHNQSLDWHLLESEQHRGVQSLVRDLNHLLRQLPALHECDFVEQGFEWIEAGDTASSTLAWCRWNSERSQPVIVIINFTPVAREFYRIGVPIGGAWVERLNSDSRHYGGSDVGNPGTVHSDNICCNQHPWSIALNLPPLGALILTPIDSN